jgi:DNA-binding NarL/FixJ family response regulator
VRKGTSKHFSEDSYPGKRRFIRLSRKNQSTLPPPAFFAMVAERSSRYVPLSFLLGASCLLPEPTSRGMTAELPVTSTGARTNAADLTPAEQRVCDLILRGLSNKEIASELGRAEPTIKNQVAAILRKHGVPSRARLLALHR